ncbi:GNAT family N-acetyltransferase [Kutzneria viridogrisea]|uniref:RimJ/RimL family protein N-acetyltransferase n=1 Tax=Kutzneria viridogrisea TaxID=47990 RepID=A0ABR6BQ75_9PSEU|nr:RimJ/RimL family protein N-acetyltransferase [Kutzneria viridogrisea]
MHVHLETDRLVLRRFTERDADLLVELDSDPEVMRYLDTGRPTPRDVVEHEVLPRILAGYRQHERFGRWAALDRADGRFLGWIALGPPGERGCELGYRLRRAEWGKGYATEGGRAVIGLGFGELGVRRVYAETMFVNAGSRRVMEKCGLSYVRTFHVDWPDPLPGTEFGEVEYAVTGEEWERDGGVLRGAGGLGA